jgi:hypothetical protein
MIPRKWRLAMLNWLGAGYMTIEQEEYNLVAEDIRSTTVDVEGLSFSVMPAQGGIIVQLRKYDDKASHNAYSTHIIAEGQDVAEHIGKIVALELWKV